MIPIRRLKHRWPCDKEMSVCTKRIIAIAAMAEKNRVIGNAGQIPWHLPEELKFFKETTMGHTLVMGRLTYESIGQPLPGRDNIVLTRDKSWRAEGNSVNTVHSLDELWPMAEKARGDCLFIIGGEEIYRLTMACWNEIILTSVFGDYEGDRFFPEFRTDEYTVGATIRETGKYRVERFERLRPH